MPTSQQIKLIHVAAKSVGLNDAQYRTLLSNAAGVESCKRLDQVGFEDCMAVLEDMGFGSKAGLPGVYWRNKVRDRGQFGNARMMHRIRDLAAHSKYPLPAMVRRISDGRTDDLLQLRPREAWKLIEMYKGSNQRNSTDKEVSHAAIQQPSLF